MDIIGYIAEYQALHGQQMGLEEIIQYFRDSGEIDILRTSIAYLLSRITGEAAALTLVYGTIFGYFFSRNLWFLLERLEGKIAPITLLILICFFLVNPIWKINGFRMWTAVHVFLYGLLPYLFDGKKNGLWIAALSILVHFSFIVPVGTLLGYLVLGNRLVIYFGFYIITLFVSEINMEAFNNLMQTYAPEILQDRTRGYRSEAYIEATEISGQSQAWFLVWNGRAMTYSIMGFLTILFLRGRPFFEKNLGWHSLFSFTLLFYGVANLLSSIPSGGRFVVIAQLCAFALIALYLQNRSQEKMMKLFVILAFPALLLYIVVAVRMGLNFTSATSIMGNPIIAYFIMGDHLSLLDVYRMIL